MQSADRALAILAAFNEARPELTVSRLATELGMHKSTASRLLATLQARGLVRRDGDRFFPGPELARLGRLAVQGLAVTRVARPILEDLAAETGETVNLAVAERGQALNVDQVQSAHFVGTTNWTGRALPLHCTANGKVLVAFGAADPPRELPALTPRTITNAGDLRAELEQTRGRGYAIAVEELEAGLHAVAAPVFDAAGACVAAVSISGPSYRLSVEALPKLGERCVAAAGEISACLGYRKAA